MKPKNNHYAHSLKNTADKSDWQTLDDHLRNVARLASKFASKFKSGKIAHIVGMLHDLGKLDPKFQDKMDIMNGLKNGPIKKVNHTGCGTSLAVSVVGSFGKSLDKNPMTAAAYCVNGHHIGLQDGKYVSSSALELIVDADKFENEMKKYTKNLNIKIKPPKFVNDENFHFWVRMLFSCLVDADYLDTEVFYTKSKRPIIKDNIDVIYEKYNKYMSNLHTIKKNGNPDMINTRNKILEMCLKSGNSLTKLFTLKAPAGGGKTLASLGFGINACRKKSHDRIIYIAPHISIIDQNADVFQNAIGENNVTQHHTNFDYSDNLKLGKYQKMICENWDGFLIITTMVQFFESLFSNTPAKCRKLHNLANSVIIIDEVHLIPLEVRIPCIKFLVELAKNYGSTILLMSATFPNFFIEIPPGMRRRDIIKFPKSIYKKLKRTNKNVDIVSEWSVEQIASKLLNHDRCLVITNLIRTAMNISDYAEKILGVKGVVYLTTRMCAKHRLDTINKIKKTLSENSCPVRIVSTTLIEAGVDIDLPVVMKEYSDCASIVQAAGRCNRENHNTDLGEVDVFKLNSSKGLSREILIRRDCMTELMDEDPDIDFDDPGTYEKYFERLFKKYPDGGKTKYENDLLNAGKTIPKDFKVINFKTYSDSFCIIDDRGEIGVIVPYENGIDFIKNVKLGKITENDITYQTVRNMQRYTVNLYENQFEKLKEKNLIKMVGTESGIYYLDDLSGTYYTPTRGILI